MPTSNLPLLRLHSICAQIAAQQDKSKLAEAQHDLEVKEPQQQPYPPVPPGSNLVARAKRWENRWSKHLQATASYLFREVPRSPSEAMGGQVVEESAKIASVRQIPGIAEGRGLVAATVGLEQEDGVQ